MCTDESADVGVHWFSATADIGDRIAVAFDQDVEGIRVTSAEVKYLKETQNSTESCLANIDYRIQL